MNRSAPSDSTGRTQTERPPLARPPRGERRSRLAPSFSAERVRRRRPAPVPRPQPQPNPASLRIAVAGTRGLPATHGGVERAVESLARESAAAGHSVTVYGRVGYCEGAQWFGTVRQIQLPTIATKHLEAAVHTMLAVLHILRHRRDYDVVHIHATGPVMIASVLRLAGIPFVATIHGLDWQRDKWGGLTRRFLRLAARVASTVPHETIVVSDELQRHIAESYGRETTCIGNGVDFDELRGAQQPLPEVADRPFVLYLGRLVPEKQVHLLIQAFAALDTDCRLVIAGAPGNDEPYAEQLRRLASADDRVVFVGPRYGAEKAWLMHQARALVLPSKLEGLPIVVLEALACGAQIVVSDIPQNRQAITIDGLPFGATFPTGDAGALTATLRPLLATSERILPDASDLVDARLNWAGFARRTESVYERAMGATPRLERRRERNRLRRV